MEKKENSVKTIQTQSISGRLPQSTFDRLSRLLDKSALDSNVCAFVSSAVEAAIEIIECDGDVKLPEFFAIARATLAIRNKKNQLFLDARS
jgi:hypothetical protein